MKRLGNLSEKAEENASEGMEGWRGVGGRVKSQSDVKRRRMVGSSSRVYVADICISEITGWFPRIQKGSEYVTRSRFRTRNIGANEDGGARGARTRYDEGWREERYGSSLAVNDFVYKSTNL